MSIGKPAQHGDPEVVAAEKKTIEMALKMGKNPRVELRDPSEAAQVPRDGRPAFLHRLGRAHPRRLVGHQGRGDARPGRGQGASPPPQRSRGRSWATTLERAAGRRPRRARAVHAARHHGRRRLCLAEGRRTGRTCCAIRRCCSPTSAPISRPRTATPRRSSRRPRRCRRQLVAEMRGRIKEDDFGVPAPDGPFAYFWKYREGGQHRADRPHAARRRRRSRSSSTATRWPRQRTTSSSAARGIRPIIALEAWSADLRGSEYFTIRVRDWDTGEDLPTSSTQTDGGVVWGSDSTFFFYVQLDDNHRPLQVYPPSARHAAVRRRAGLRGAGRRLVHPYR